MLIALIISVSILFAAPLFGKQLQNHVDWRQTMDGFVVVAVLGIISFNIMPAVLESDISYISLIFLAGLALPTLAERILKGREVGTHRLALLIPAFAMILHALGDGAVLKLIDGEPMAPGIAIGIVLHRVGLGAAIWWMVVNSEGSRAGFVFVSMIAITTLAGYVSTFFLLEYTAAPEIELVQAFAAGSLLHIILHPLNHEELEHGRGRGRHRAGSLLGGALVIAIIGLHLVGQSGFALNSVGLHDRENADALVRIISFGAGLSPLLLAFVFTAHISDRLRILAPMSLILWLLMFAFVPISFIPDLFIGQYILLIYGILLIFFMARFGGRTAIAYILPKSFHTHTHEHDH